MQGYSMDMHFRHRFRTGVPTCHGNDDVQLAQAAENMAEWQFVFQVWVGVVPNAEDYEFVRVPPEMQVQHLFFCRQTAHLKT